MAFFSKLKLYYLWKIVGDCVITCVTLIFCQQHYRGDTNLYMINVTLNNLFASA